MYDLLYAAAVGDVETVNRCLDRSQRANFSWGDITRACGRGRIALHYAASAGDSVKDLQDSDGMTPLMAAAIAGHLETVQILVGARVDLHKQDKTGMTAAHHAAVSKHQSCLDYLLDKGSHLLAINCIGQMLIHLAALSGDASMVESLLHRGIPVSGGPHHLQTPLHMAVQGGHSDVANVLLSRKAPINAKNSRGETPLHVLCLSNQRHPGIQVELAKLLLSDKKISLREVDCNRREALSYAKNLDVRNLIKETLQGKRPNRPRMPVFEKAVKVEDPPLPKHRPLICTPHPNVPGHVWPSARLQGNNIFGKDPDPSQEDDADCKLERLKRPKPPCPFHLDIDQFGSPTKEYKIAALEQSAAVWRSSPITRHVRPNHCNTDLLPADQMWIDSPSTKVVNLIPAREYLGRYRS